MIKKYHIGLTQWAYQPWKENFFSKDSRPDEFLNQYSSVFNAVEGNTTFYRVPELKTVKEWGSKVPDGFKFCFKFPRTITHDKRLNDAQDDAKRFVSLFEPIREKLGPFHIQLSSNFSYNEMGKLESFLMDLPADVSFAVEVRHPDFFDKGKKEDYLLRLLRTLNMDRVIFDTRKLYSMKSNDESIVEAQRKKPKPNVRFEVTGSRPFIRYIGANDELNNVVYLKEWAIVVADWIREGLHPYFFIHAPDTFFAPVLGRRFHSELSKLIELQPMPEWPSERKDEQLNLF
jgi:uncharacterized protein YecE (DUF72 family)